MAELEEVKKIKTTLISPWQKIICDIKSFQMLSLQKEIRQILEEPARSSALQMDN